MAVKPSRPSCWQLIVRNPCGEKQVCGGRYGLWAGAPGEIPRGVEPSVALVVCARTLVVVNASNAEPKMIRERKKGVERSMIVLQRGPKINRLTGESGSISQAQGVSLAQITRIIYADCLRKSITS